MYENEKIEKIMSFLKEYTMLHELGQGGFAKVYKVRHDELGYIRAVRVLDKTVTPENEKAYKSFLNECKTLLRLGNGNHPNIVHIYQPRKVYDESIKAHKALVEMDFVDGCDLRKYLETQNYFVPTEEILQLIQDISSALAYCHEDIFKSCMDKDIDKLQDHPQNPLKALHDPSDEKRLIEKYKVLHNDIHDGNVMRREYDGSYILLDFGLAIEGEDTIPSSSKRDNGRREYFAPERYDVEDDKEHKLKLTEQMDIYSFGVLMFQMLAGRHPFTLENPKSLSQQMELKRNHKGEPVPPVFPLRQAAYEAAHPGKTYEKDYPDWLEQVIMKCLEKKPENRFANGKKLFLEVERKLKETNESNHVELQKLKAANEDLTRTLGVISKDNGELKQENRDMSLQIKELLQKVENSKKAGIWKILTGIAAVVAIVMIFAYLGKPTGNFDAAASSYEATITEQKNTIENLQNENATLQNDLKTAQNSNHSTLNAQIFDLKNKNAELESENERLKNQSAKIETVTKDVVKDNPEQVKKIRELEIQVTELEKDRDRWKTRAMQ
ncbi:hypothetical protein FACS189428_3270 [Clostridia bacterium]|nr:hypothetical protein FACS189428_3270 [Clostridia bacterium]